MKKRDIMLIIGMVLAFVGMFLPAIKIANENISFLKENGCLAVILIAIMFVLYMLNRKIIMALPASVLIVSIVKFVLDNKFRLAQITELYNCFAKFRYGLLVMIFGSVLIILTLCLTSISYGNLFDTFKSIWVLICSCLVGFKKLFLNLKDSFVSLIKNGFEFLVNKFKSLNVSKKINVAGIKKKVAVMSFNFKEKISGLRAKKILNKNILTKEKMDDGVVKYNKMVVKLNKKSKFSIKNSFRSMWCGLCTKKLFVKKLSVSKFNEDYKTCCEHDDFHNFNSCQVAVIDITKWTRDSVCCVNCGATVSSNSEYCFLCDCKIRINEKKGEKFSELR